MSNQLEVDNELFEEIMWGERYKEVEEVSQEHFKHDITAYTVAFTHEGDNYLMTYCSSYNNGVEEWDFPLVAKKAKKVTKTIEVWEVIQDAS